jgi:hypothetical protein
MTSEPTSRDDFPAAIICAKPIEYDAVCLLIDRWYDAYKDKREMGDSNV